jgi:hypothetical protein
MPINTNNIVINNGHIEHLAAVASERPILAQGQTIEHIQRPPKQVIQHKPINHLVKDSPKTSKYMSDIINK